MEFTITITLEQDEDGWYIVTVPALPGCISQGKTEEEAKKNIAEAIELHLSGAATRFLQMNDPGAGDYTKERKKWLESDPEKYIVAAIEDSHAQRGKRMAAALNQLAKMHIFSDIKDPVAWQCEIRRDRQLPGR